MHALFEKIEDWVFHSRMKKPVLKKGRSYLSAVQGDPSHWCSGLCRSKVPAVRGPWLGVFLLGHSKTFRKLRPTFISCVFKISFEHSHIFKAAVSYDSDHRTHSLNLSFSSLPLSVSSSKKTLSSPSSHLCNAENKVKWESYFLSSLHVTNTGGNSPILEMYVHGNYPAPRSVKNKQSGLLIQKTHHT